MTVVPAPMGAGVVHPEARTGSPGVHHETAIRRPELQWPVRVPIDNHIGGGVTREQRFRLRTPELVAVTDVQRQVADRERTFARQHRIEPIVDVAGHGHDLRHGPKRSEDLRTPYVTCVDDQIDTAKDVHDARPELPVCIGDESHDRPRHHAAGAVASTR